MAKSESGRLRGSTRAGTTLPRGGLPGKLTRRQASEARREFFALLQAVIHDPTEVVLIEHKDLPEPAALVNAPFLMRTLRLVTHLRNQWPSSDLPFRLIGSATLVGSADDVLAEVRAEQRSRQQAKFSDA
jgi:hypothetical protein